ncbi:MAG: FCD domain-containing protein [Streptosporangiales bacterium]|nr:FCD domain-containing protein [Streptosporangiales bacterium]
MPNLPAAPPVQRSNLKDAVASYIRDLIFSGHLGPGAKIDQDAVAQVLGVSKLPVREALIVLESAALVEVAPRRGAFVAPLTRDDLRDHYRIYGAVSAIAAERAASVMEPATVELLRKNVTRMCKPQPDDDLEQLNHDFHRLINKSGGSRRLDAVLRSLSAMMFGEFFQTASEWGRVAAKQHDGICTAIKDHDGEAAARLMRQHIVEGGEYAISLLEQRGFWE